MSLDELRAQKETLKEPYPVGDYKVMVNLGEEGYFSDGKCGAVPSGRVANCFNDTTITVFNADGDRQFNSRQLPLQVGIYTKEEIDGLLNRMKSEYDEKIQTINKKFTYQDVFTASVSTKWSNSGDNQGLGGGSAYVTREMYINGNLISSRQLWGSSGSGRYSYGGHSITIYNQPMGGASVYFDGYSWYLNHAGSIRHVFSSGEL